MSLRCRIFRTVLFLMGVKKMFGLPREELLHKIKKANQKRGFRMPTDKKCVCGDRIISGKYHCLTMRTGAEKSHKAILFLFGGGYLMGPDSMDIALARRIGAKSGSDVWFPFYPLCADTCITETYGMAFECYRRMLDEYLPENISFVGASSGAALAVGILLHNNALGRPLPVPRVVIACSPGSVPVTETEREKARALDEKDGMVSSEFMENVREWMEHGEQVPLYMLSGVSGDFTGLPEIHFYYGSDEVLYAEADGFAAACEKYSVPYQMTVGQGMGHCYAMMPFFPEGKAALKEIIQILRE